MTDEQVELAERMAVSGLEHISCSGCPIRDECCDGCVETFLRWFTSGELQELPKGNKAWRETRTLAQMFEDGDDP